MLFLSGSRRASVQLWVPCLIDLLPSWCSHCCSHLASMPVTCHPDAARLTGNVRGTRQMTTSPSFRANAGLSVTWRWATACHLFTYSFNVGKMSRRRGAGGRTSDKRQRESEWLQERKIWQTLFGIKISTRAISYISMGMPAQKPIISSILGKKSDLQSRNFGHVVCRGWGGGRQTTLPLDYIKSFEFLAHLISAIFSDCFISIFSS